MTEVPEHLLRRSAARRARIDPSYVFDTEVIPGKEGVNGSDISQAIADEIAVDLIAGECSILASDSAKTATHLFDDVASPRRLDYGSDIFLRDGTFVATNRSFPTKVNGWISREETWGRFNTFNINDMNTPHDSLLRRIGTDVITTGGYVVQLALSAPVESEMIKRRFRGERRGPDMINVGRLALVGLVRHNIALPLVYFKRSNTSYCDYLQFTGEEEMDELSSINFYGWGQDDTSSRFDAVAEVRATLERRQGSQKLLAMLRVNERIEAILGKTSASQEMLNARMFSADVPYSILKPSFVVELPNVRVGKVKTNVTIEGRLMVDEQGRRLFYINKHPSSQERRADQDDLYVFDKRGLPYSASGEQQQPITETEMAIINALLDTAESKPQ